MKTFITSDWHLGEQRFEIMQRPFKYQIEMIQHFKDNHNSLVGPDDLVYVVGDCVYDMQKDFIQHIPLFNGKKILIRGNQERVLTDEELSPYFIDIIPEGEGIELDVAGIPCYLNHYPSKARKDKFNLVGHIHSAWKVQLNMVNVGVDANHFYPHELEKMVKFYYKAVTEFYDKDVWTAYSEPNMQFVGIRGKNSSYLEEIIHE